MLITSQGPRGGKGKIMATRRKRRVTYIPASRFLGKTPESRQRQLDNLQRGRQPKPIMGEGLADDVKPPNQYPDDPIGFIEHHFYELRSKAPIKLLPWQVEVLQGIFYRKVRPSLAVCGSVKKSGKGVDSFSPSKHRPERCTPTVRLTTAMYSRS